MSSENGNYKYPHPHKPGVFVSRQRLAQIRHREKGKCPRCFNPRGKGKKGLCKKCDKKVNKARKAA